MVAKEAKPAREESGVVLLPTQDSGWRIDCGLCVEVCCPTGIDIPANGTPRWVHPFAPSSLHRCLQSGDWRKLKRAPDLIRYASEQKYQSRWNNLRFTYRMKVYTVPSDPGIIDWHCLVGRRSSGKSNLDDTTLQAITTGTLGWIGYKRLLSDQNWLIQNKERTRS